MDDTDTRLLGVLAQNGRASWAELAETVGMSTPGVIDRVRRLEERGVIEGYGAHLSYRALGFTLTSFVFLKLVPSAKREAFLKLVRTTPQIEECHHVTGAHDYLLKLRCRDAAELDLLLIETLKGSGHVASTETLISLSETRRMAVAAELLSAQSERSERRPPNTGRRPPRTRSKG